MRVNIEVQHICEKQQNLRGIPYYILNLVKSLVVRNNNNYSISFFDQNKERNNRKFIDEYIEDEVRQNISIHECNSLSFKTIIDSCINGNSLLYNNRSYNDYIGINADVFHFPHIQFVPRNVNGRIVVTAHDIMPLLPGFQTFWGDKSRASFKNSIHYVEQREDIIIIADSLSTKNDILTYSEISQERIHVVPLAYDTKIHYPEKNEEVLTSMQISSPYLLYLGMLDFRKGIVDILEAFEALKPRYSDLKLVLAGALKPSVESIHRKLSNCRYRADVILPGYVNDEQKRALLSSATVFLFPSEYEGFGLPVLEAMACGCPVITTNVSSLPEVGGNAAIYVSPKNPEQLGHEIDRLLVSESLRQEYIVKGIEHSGKFSWDKTAQMTEEVYKLSMKVGRA